MTGPWLTDTGRIQCHKQLQSGPVRLFTRSGGRGGVALMRRKRASRRRPYNAAVKQLRIRFSSTCKLKGRELWDVKLYYTIPWRWLGTSRRRQSSVLTSCMREAATICPHPLQAELWSCDLERWCPTHAWRAGYLCAKFSLPRPLCSRLRPDVFYTRQTDVRC